MKELKVGMYIRYIPTQGNYTQKISKITKTKNCMLDMAYYLDNSEEPVFSSHFGDIVGVSEYIIGLIEVGDYVNGDKVTEEMIKMRDEQGVFGLPDKNKVFIGEIKVKNIVTKEQFESVKYEVE